MVWLGSKNIYLAAEVTDYSTFVFYFSWKASPINVLAASALRSGRRSRRFKSSHPDHLPHKENNGRLSQP